MIDIEPNGVTNTCDTIWIHHNTFGAQRLSFIASKGYPARCDNVTIEDNTCANMFTTVFPTASGLRHNWIIRNNVAYAQYGTSSGSCLRFWRVEGLTVTGNTQTLQSGRGMHLCKTYDCTDIDISGNTIPGGIGQYYEQNTPDPGTDPVSETSGLEAPVVVGTSTFATTAAAVTVAVPGGTQVGDELVAFVGHMGTPFAPRLAGWEILADGELLPESVLPGHFVLAQRPFVSGTSTVTFPMNEGGVNYRTSVIVMSIRGIGPAQFPTFVAEANDSYANSSEIIVPGATTRTANELVMFFAAQRGGNGVMTIPAGLDLVGTARNVSSTGVSIAAASTVYTGTGSGATRTFSSSVIGVDYGVVASWTGYPVALAVAERVQYTLEVTIT